jgi:chromosome segregation ATPase
VRGEREELERALCEQDAVLAKLRQRHATTERVVEGMRAKLTAQGHALYSLVEAEDRAANRAAERTERARAGLLVAKKELEGLQASNATVQREIARCKQAAKDQAARLARALSAADDREARLSAREAALGAREAALGVLEAALGAREAALAALEADAGAQEVRHAQLEVEVAERAGQCAGLLERLAQSGDARQALEAEHAAREAALAAREAALAALEVRRAQLEVEVAERAGQCAGLLERLAQLGEARQALEARLEAETRSLEARELDAEALRAKLAALEAEARSLEARELDAEALRAELAALEAELAAMRRRKNWLAYQIFDIAIDMRGLKEKIGLGVRTCTAMAIVDAMPLL